MYPSGPYNGQQASGLNGVPPPYPAPSCLPPMGFTAPPTSGYPSAPAYPSSTYQYPHGQYYSPTVPYSTQQPPGPYSTLQHPGAYLQQQPGAFVPQYPTGCPQQQSGAYPQHPPMPYQTQQANHPPMQPHMGAYQQQSAYPGPQNPGAYPTHPGGY